MYLPASVAIQPWASGGASAGIGPSPEMDWRAQVTPQVRNSVIETLYELGAAIRCVIALTPAA